MKTCTKCGLPKPLEQFYRHPCTRDGRKGSCIECYLADKRRQYSAADWRLYRLAKPQDRAPEPRAAISDPHDPLSVEAQYRADRRRDLTKIGGICGVRAIRARMREAGRLKRLARGGDIPAAILDAMLPG